MALSFVTSNGVELIVDYLWMDAMGFSQVFLTVFSTKATLAVIGFVIGFLVLWPNLTYALKQVGGAGQMLPAELMATPLGMLFSDRLARWTIAGISALIGLMSGLALTAGWENPLLYLNAVPFNQVDPYFGFDVAFYIFTLPFLQQIQSFLWSIFFFTTIGVGAVYFLKLQSEKIAPTMIQLDRFPKGQRLHMGILAGLLLAGLAADVFLKRYAEMYKAGGLFSGPGYAEIFGTIPALALTAVVALVAAVVVIVALLRSNFRLLAGMVILLGVFWVGGSVYSSLLERFVVAPNQLEKERPYLQSHIKATNLAFGLDKVEARTLTKDTELTADDIAANRPTINNVRLWDHEPLLDTFAQIQEIRTYYEFVSVDNDRYMIDGELRQTMLSPREMNSQSLPSRTWVNERLTFTHGYGLTAGPVNRVNEQGLPTLFVQDLPPKSEQDELKISDPEIYFGELTDNYVFVKTNQQEFNYPEGDANIFSTYDGKGGIELNSLWRRLLFAVYLRDMKLLLSDDFTDETRILFHRNVAERMRVIAPFFHYDNDPYMVIHKGRLKWIFDIYTISDSYPYSEHVGELGNYMANPVKGVIDAKDGTVEYYMIDPNEPIAATYAKMFPGIVKPIAAMDEGLRAHLRHPPGFFNIQANTYATYHMLDVNTFYNKEDQWSVPVVGQKRMEPYFTVMKLPEEAKEEFILMLPFTPRLKDNLAAWMVARSDGDQYGKLVVYNFPKQKLIFGPKQMVARINQEPGVSQQITLWDQSGSNVIRGTLLVIPIENSLIYIQPLYLKAEDGKIPELKRVIVGYQNSIAMGQDLEDALSQIFGSETPTADQGKSRPKATETSSAQTPSSISGIDTLGDRALRQYKSLNEAAQRGDWARFGRELKTLGNTLEKIIEAAR